MGGFILNFMPCVLPVIGLKLMAFVQQSGDSRGRVFALNVSYTLGLVSVFMVLATMVVSLFFTARQPRSRRPGRVGPVIGSPGVGGSATAIEGRSSMAG